MSLAEGQRLGPYEVLGRIGAGGMGEVYRARDTRLDRTVALKVLASEVSANGELRSRFEPEARAIAALAHPHIRTLSVSQDGGRSFATQTQPLPPVPEQASRHHSILTSSGIAASLQACAPR
jgi:serine/threonine protein kinase